MFPFTLILPMQADSVMSGHVAREFEVGRLPAHSCHEWYCQMPDHPALEQGQEGAIGYQCRQGVPLCPFLCIWRRCQPPRGWPFNTIVV